MRSAHESGVTVLKPRIRLLEGVSAALSSEETAQNPQRATPRLAPPGRLAASLDLTYYIQISRIYYSHSPNRCYIVTSLPEHVHVSLPSTLLRESSSLYML
jgi:hypothetical protein